MSQIRLAVVKDRLIPADTESYRKLHALNIPNVCFPYAFLDTLKILTTKKRLQLVGVPFQNIHEEFLTKVEQGWLKHPKRNLKISKGSMRFEAKGLVAPSMSFAKVEACLRSYFDRWGFDAEFNYSETPTRARLIVEYRQSKDKLPIIPFKDVGNDKAQ